MTAPAPLLRTLVPALRGLERGVNEWLAAADRRYPVAPLRRANLEGLRDDLRRRADDLDRDQPFLVILLMGGTGVGKSTLLNALAGSPIAQASFTRPTTRDPVVYHHRALKPERLDPALRNCRLVAHDREELREKVLVDTPDLDSNEEANRERLMHVLPVADVVLYVGSQEKYHDRIGWQLFQSQQKRRAFAFVLNKWDRCSRPTSGGMRPDEDLLRDLKSEGFADPLLFRTSAQYWIGQADGEAADSLPEGEQFQELVRWLSDGLTRLEIEALKARGVTQLLEQLHAALEGVRPPDLTQAASVTRPAWEQVLGDEAPEFSDLLLNTLEPHQREIEHHFRVSGNQRAQRLMAAYLGCITWIQSAGSKFRNPVKAVTGSITDGPRTWDLQGLTRECISVAGKRGLDQRQRALGDRLIVAANERGFPGELLAPRVKELANLDWRGQFQSAVGDALGQVEREWSQPTGSRRLLRGGLVVLANIVPELTFVGTVLLLMWRLVMKDQPLSLGTVLVPFVLTLAVLMVFHLLIHLLLPLRWSAIRHDFRKRLEAIIADRLVEGYAPAPAALASELAAERVAVDRLAREVADLSELLDSRRQAAHIDAMYGTK